MRAVAWKFGAGFNWWAVHYVEDVRAAFNSLMSGERLSVRYDNGQLCTFRRKSPPQGGEG